MTLSPPLAPGSWLGSRYEIVQILGAGGFGRTYLAKDQNRFGELCVLKEFAPQVQDEITLQKAKELFQREAGTLYQLQHPQIPTFRELLQVPQAADTGLFLVEQYIEGLPYSVWLQQGHRLSEAEAIRLLLDLLPVLTYIHHLGVIHRDISPDNLIYQQTTGKPVLIDFGSVKQVVITAMQQTKVRSIPTRIEKLGYTPAEQLRGRAYPCSDLYALAATVLVLVTGESPWELYDERRQVWRWRQLIRLNSRLEDILENLLSANPYDRHQSALEVQQALQPIAGLAASAQAVTAPATSLREPTPVGHSQAPTSTFKTWAVAPGREMTAVMPPASPFRNPLAHLRLSSKVWPALRWLLRLPLFLGIFLCKWVGWLLQLIGKGLRAMDWMLTWVKRLIMLGLILAGVAIATWWWQPQRTAQVPAAAKRPKTCQEVITHYEALGLPKSRLYAQVDQRLYARYPELKGRRLTNQPQDRAMRQEWCQIAEELLNAEAKR